MKTGLSLALNWWILRGARSCGRRRTKPRDCSAALPCQSCSAPESWRDPRGIPEEQGKLGSSRAWAASLPPVPPLPWQGHLPLSQAAPSSNVQPGLGHCQGSRGSPSCSGHPVPGPAHPPREQFLPNLPSIPALWRWDPFPVSCPSMPCPQSLCSSSGAPSGPARGSELSLDFLLSRWTPPALPAQLQRGSSPGAAPWPPLDWLQQPHALGRLSDCLGGSIPSTCGSSRRTRPCRPGAGQVFTKYGKCYMFNSGEEGRPLLTTVKGGTGNGLEIMLDIQQDEYLPIWGETEETTFEAGVKVQIHSQSEPPFVQELGFGVAPGFQTFVATQEQRLTYLPPPWGECRSPELGLAFFPVYSVTACRIDCETRYIVENCNCRMVHMPGDAPFCTPEQYKECAEPALSLLAEKDSSYCICRTPCNLTRYNKELSMVKIPSKTSAKYLEKKFNKSEKYISENILVLDIFFEALNYETIEQKKAYEVAALLGPSFPRLWSFGKSLIPESFAQAQSLQVTSVARWGCSSGPASSPSSSSSITCTS
uniref:Uncharacterized protein n=1 Tax=Corvus moneduloides TaxID=1196302 RepID=A0A8U7NJP0_CORMO